MSIMMSDMLHGIVDENSIENDLSDVVIVLDQALSIRTIIIDDKACRILADANKDIFYSLLNKSKQKASIKLNNNIFCAGEIISFGWDTTTSKDSCLFLIVRR